MNEEESPDEIAADEALWDVQFVASQEGMAKMAGRALAEIKSGALVQFAVMTGERAW